jgi:hypothetical protein
MNRLEGKIALISGVLLSCNERQEHMKRFHACFVLLMVSLIGVSQARASASIPQASTADYQAIETLLASYTRCVTEHDEASFRALLLDEKIPFADVEESAASNNPPDLRQYEGFRQSVFASGQRFRQRFYNVRIEQHGALAQVSLDFVTEQGSGKRGSATGWKVLQLVKVGGRWKIASELYTFSRTPTGGQWNLGKGSATTLPVARIPPVETSGSAKQNSRAFWIWIRPDDGDRRAIT